MSTTAAPTADLTLTVRSEHHAYAEARAHRGFAATSRTVEHAERNRAIANAYQAFGDTLRSGLAWVRAAYYDLSDASGDYCAEHSDLLPLRRRRRGDVASGPRRAPADA